MLLSYGDTWLSPMTLFRAYSSVNTACNSVGVFLFTAAWQFYEANNPIWDLSTSARAIFFNPAFTYDAFNSMP